MRKFLGTIAVLVIAVVLAWTNWDRVGPIIDPILGAQTAPDVSVTEAGPVTLGVAPEQRHRLVLIDPTTSTDVSFRESMKNDILAALQGYVPPKPTEPAVGVPALVGLQLTVRLVSTNSLAFGQENVAISIPSVPELPARPNMAAPGALDPLGPYDTWKESEAEWSSSYDTALSASAAAIEALQSLNVNTDEQSGILAGVAALALLAPTQGDVAFAVLSDLDENRGRQPASLNGHRVLLVQPDPFGDIGRWDALFGSFSSWAAANGAGEITRVRPELASAAISTFITGE